MSTTAVTADQLDLVAINARLENAAPAEIIAWAAETFASRFVMTSSFGAQSAVMLHLVCQVVPNIPVIFVDTGYLFPETYRFADELTERLRLNLKVYQADMTPARMEAIHGPLWEKGEEGMDRYNQLRKVEPMQRAIRELDVKAWAAGLRRQQTAYRASLATVAVQDGIVKVHPILRWTARDVHEYLKQHNLPYHPLYDQGYHSIGDVHSTTPITAEQHERDGRFRGLKQECGLHLPTSAEESESRDSSCL